MITSLSNKANKIHLPDTLSIQTHERIVSAINERWEFALDSLGIPKQSGRLVFAQTLSCYTQPWRHYHNLEHLSQLFVFLKKINLDAYNDPAIILGVLFHDAVYDPLAKNNEEESAKLCRKQLTSLNIPEEVISKAELLIAYSKNHLLANANNTEGAFLDADLGILAQPREEFMKYARMISAEYSSYPTQNYINGRSKFLFNMLKADNIFRTPPFASQLNEIARQNMQHEMLLLATNPETVIGNQIERIMYEWPKHVIALTGGIGSGKSTVLSILEEMGAFVVSADSLVRKLYSENELLRHELVKLFGDKALLFDGSIDRKYIASFVFSDPVMKEYLEQLTHPFVFNLASLTICEAIQLGKDFIVYEMPLLFEKQLQTLKFKK
jgi:predicted metal-dependent HD superfamily phosphohydrolase